MSELFAHAQGPSSSTSATYASRSGLTRCETSRHEVRRGIQYNHQSVVKYIPTEYYHTCHTVSRLLVTTVRTHTHTEGPCALFYLPSSPSLSHSRGTNSCPRPRPRPRNLLLVLPRNLPQLRLASTCYWLAVPDDALLQGSRA